MTSLSQVHTIGKQLKQAVRIENPSLKGAALQTLAMELLDSVRIRTPEDQLRKYPHQLSGGMLQRVFIAMAFAAEAELLVANGPTSALDVTARASTLDLLVSLQEKETGVAILMITP